MTARSMLCLALLSFSLDAAEEYQSDRSLPALELPRPLSHRNRRHEIKVEDLLRLRHIGGVSISPDGQWVAFTLRQANLESNGYRTALFVTSTAGHGKIVNLGSVGPPVFHEWNYPLTVDPVWSGDSRFVMYPMQGGAVATKQGKSQLFRWSREGGPPKQLTHSETSVLYAVRTSEGRILYSTMGARPELTALKNKYLDHGIWYFDFDKRPNSLASISPSHTRRGTDVLDQALHHMLILYEPATSQWLDDAPYEVYTLAAEGKGDRRATEEELRLYRKLAESHRAVSTSQTSIADRNRMWVVGPHGSEITFQEEPNGGEDQIGSPSLVGHRLIYSMTKNGSVLGRVSPRSDFSYSDCSYSISARRFACVGENPVNPPEVISFNLDSSDEQILTDLNPEVREWNLPSVELTQWIDSKGNPGYGYLYKPNGLGSGPYPTMVLPYTIATYDFSESAVVMEEYPTYAFTSRGYAVLRPDVQFYIPKAGNASGVTEKLLMNEATLDTILAGINRLSEMGITDKSRVGIAGLSQGAKYASYAVAHSRAFAAASVTAVVPSPLNSAGAYYGSAEALRDNTNHNDEAQIVDGLERARAEESQVTDWADRVSAPVLVDASDGEWVWSVQAAIALRARSKPVEMVVYPHASHFKKWPRQLDSVWTMNLDWFDFWLRNFCDPSPEKKEQYERWTKLKSSQVQDVRTATYLRPSW